MSLINSTAIPSGASAYEIEQSLRFNDDDSPYLTFQPSSASNRKTYTFSFWFKRATQVNESPIFTSNQGHEPGFNILFGGHLADDFELNIYDYTSGSANIHLRTTQKFRDSSAWYHIVVAVDTTQGTAANRAKIYVNGNQVTDFATETYPSLNLDTNMNNPAQTAGKTWSVGSSTERSQYADGYLSEFNCIDGTALTPSSFGETGDYGEWKPKEYSGSYGTNGFYLNFATAADMGDDKSGNTNDWTENNIAATDQMLDSPTNNFATWNPLSGKVGHLPTLSEGNLAVATQGVMASMSMALGKWYWEALATSSDADYAIGVADIADANSTVMSGQANPAQGFIYQANGNARKDGSVVASWATFTDGDIISFSYDQSNHQLKAYKNNSISGTLTLTAPRNEYIPCTITLGGSFTANFGQDSSFAGNKTAQGNQDGNDIGDFYYTPPTGFLALCTSNLPDVAVTPSEHFNTVTYSGTGSTQSITVGFQPDFTWFKSRSAARAHVLVDSVRGVTKELISNTTGAEQTSASDEDLTAFTSTGFTLGDVYNNSPNESGASIVAWNWKANGSGSSNTNGSINSTVSANADAGFSIVSYTGNGTAGATVGHGLTVAPEMIFEKKRSATDHWQVYNKDLHASTPEDWYLILNLSNAAMDYEGIWNDTAPTNSVFSLGSYGGGNQSSATYIAYCFHSVDGYSKVGSYTGNGSTDGTFIYTGFRPAFVLVKSIDSANGWWIIDNKRDTYNLADAALAPYSSAAEQGVYANKDLLSNGFKIRTANGQHNASGFSYMYLAFAETPFKYSNAR